jgi:undecaprenyl-diphosphatase
MESQMNADERRSERVESESIRVHLRSSAVDSSATDTPAVRLEWLTAARCRFILALVLSVGFLARLWFLHHNCPIDLGGDEAQYWDWSRNLDLSYYSKGPLVAYIIRASCAVFGDTMQAVRYPALVFAVLTSIVTYLLTWRLFGSERLALGAALLLQILPLFIAGNVLMTIDPPMFFCWALATYLAAIAVFDRRRSIWIAVGVIVGVGFLAKYSTMLWFVGILGFLVQGPHSNLLPEYREKGSGVRHQVGVTGAVLIAALFTIPVLIWNQQHNWVSLRHVARQTGAADGAFNPANVLAFLGGQFGAVGPTMAILMVAAVICTIVKKPGDEPNRPKLFFLLWIGGAFFIFNLLASFRAKVQPNWPAPTYFTLVILTAYFISTRFNDATSWKRWRPWVYATVFIGVMLTFVIHNTPRLYPLHLKIAQIDPEVRLVGWQVLGQHVREELNKLGPGAFVLCDDYQQTAEMAFYVPGQPRTYCAGSYFGKRLSQYDMWPDRRLDSTSELIGRDAIYLGKGGPLPQEVSAAFEQVEKRWELPIMAGQNTVRTFKLWRCRGFRGMNRPPGEPES